MIYKFTINQNDLPYKVKRSVFYHCLSIFRKVSSVSQRLLQK